MNWTKTRIAFPYLGLHPNWYKRNEKKNIFFVIEISVKNMLRFVRFSMILQRLRHQLCWPALPSFRTSQQETTTAKMEGNTSLKRKEGHEADAAKAQGTPATSAASEQPPKHKKARTEEENTERGDEPSEQVRLHQVCCLFKTIFQ